MNRLQKFVLNVKVRNLAAKKPDFMHPASVNVGKWTEIYHGNRSRCDWISRLIIEECERDEAAGQGVYISCDAELSLDEIGICNHWDTLTGFFGADEVREVTRYLRNENKMVRWYEDTAEAVKTMPKEKLAELLGVWTGYKTQDQTGAEVKRNMIRIIRSAAK